MAKTNEKKLAYNKAYVKKNCYQVALSLNRNTDADIIIYLETLDNKQGFIKKLIRKFLSENA